MSQVSYCLDINVGRNESYREELIKFLVSLSAVFDVTQAQCGMWQGTKILRVQTSKAEELIQHITDGLRTGDDNDYEIHLSPTDANRCMTWLPDLDTARGYSRFDLSEVAIPKS